MDAASTAATVAGGPGWHTCLNTSTIRPAGLLDKIRIAAAAGYQAVELWHDDLDAFLAAGGTLAVVRRALDEAGLAVPGTVHLRDWLAPEQERYEAALADACRKLEQAAALGARHLICGPGSYGDDLPLAIDRYRALLKLGRAYGVLPAVEFLGWGQHLNSLPKAWAVVAGAGEPGGSVVVDSFHMFRGGSTVDDLRRIPGERIAVFHINDAPAEKPRTEQTDADRVYPGDGVIDLRGLLGALRENGYRGSLSLELFNQALWALDPAQVARTGLAKLRAVMAAAA